MKSYAVMLTVRQTRELRDLLNIMAAETDMMHKLTYGEIYALDKAYVKLVAKCKTLTFRNARKKYKVSFVPHEAEIMQRVFMECRLKFTPYAGVTVNSFVGQVDRQQDDYRLTYLSQHPLDIPDEVANHHQIVRKFKGRDY